MSKNDMLGPLTRALVRVSVKRLGLMLDIANRLGDVDAENFYTDLAKFVREWKKKAVQVVEEATTYIWWTLFGNVEIGPTDGTIKGKDVASFYYDRALWGVKSKPVPAKKVKVGELRKDGTFSDFLGKTAGELERLRLQWAQAFQFCVDHEDKLRKDGNATFFVCTTDGEAVRDDLSNLFIAYVHETANSSYLRLVQLARPIDSHQVWLGENLHRIVAPQEAA